MGSGAEVVDHDALRPRVVQVTAALEELALIGDSPVPEVEPAGKEGLDSRWEEGGVHGRF